MKRLFTILAIPFAAVACQPPAADNYVERVELVEKHRPVGEPLPSPDTVGAIWAASDEPLRLLYGKPGDAPLIALACELGGEEPMLKITRFARADAEAKALFAFVGNGHVARVPVDAIWNGHAWLWEGVVPADTYALGALTGARSLYATLPGAGKVEIHASPRPRQLIEACRDSQAAGEVEAKSRSAAEESAPEQPAPPR